MELKKVWVIGQNYFIRTITHHYTGTLVEITDKELVLENAAWIPEDGRFSNALKNEEFSEVEPFPDVPIIIGRGTVLDATPITKIFREQKP
jgi:hypothetical protein